VTPTAAATAAMGYLEVAEHMRTPFSDHGISNPAIGTREPAHFVRQKKQKARYPFGRGNGPEFAASRGFGLP
jgi:hypothetical protein